MLAKAPSKWILCPATMILVVVAFSIAYLVLPSCTMGECVDVSGCASEYRVIALRIDLSCYSSDGSREVCALHRLDIFYLKAICIATTGGWWRGVGRWVSDWATGQSCSLTDVKVVNPEQTYRVGQLETHHECTQKFLSFLHHGCVYVCMGAWCMCMCVCVCVWCLCIHTGLPAARVVGDLPLSRSPAARLGPWCSLRPVCLGAGDGRVYVRVCVRACIVGLSTKQHMRDCVTKRERKETCSPERQAFMQTAKQYGCRHTRSSTHNSFLPLHVIEFTRICTVTICRTRLREATSQYAQPPLRLITTIATTPPRARGPARNCHLGLANLELHLADNWLHYILPVFL